MKAKWNGWSRKKKIVIVILALVVMATFWPSKNQQSSSATQSALEYVQEKKWSVGDLPCDLNGGSYLVYTKDRGLIQTAAGKEAVPQNDSAPITFEYLPLTPKSFTYKQTVYANAMVGQLLKDPKAVTAEVEEQITLVNENKITYINKVKEINFDKLMKGIKAYDITEERGESNLCKFVNSNTEVNLDQCKAIQSRLAATNKNFPNLLNQSINQLVTWRASMCEAPPRGSGVVTALCEGKTRDGTNVFYWEKNNDGKFESNFLSCK
jgi:hypothetical protein